MSLFVSTQSYRDDEPTPYGLLIQVDENDGQIIRKLRIDTPVDAINEGGRLKPGLRGLYQYRDKIYTASWNKIFIINKETLEVEHEISHKWMSDVHGIFVNQEGIWVTSSYPDALILYDFNGNPQRCLWIPETCIYSPRSQVDKEMDWRFKGKDFRGFRQYHINHVEINNGYVYITGRGEGNNNGRVVRFKKERFLNSNKLQDRDLELYTQRLFGPHDGLWDGDILWLTETNNMSIAAINTNGKVISRKTMVSREGEKIKYDSLMESLKFKYRKLIGQSGKRDGFWTRGLCIYGDYIYVGQSAWAGDEKGIARIVKVNKKTKKIANCFFFQLPNYPEMRIYQIMSNSS